MSEKKKYLIDVIADADKPEVEWTQIDSNAGSIMGEVKRQWEDSNHPQKKEILKEYSERMKNIMMRGSENKGQSAYDNILYLSCWLYTVWTEEDEEEYDDWEGPDDDYDLGDEGENDIL